jgi:hypothetical protein
MPGRAKRFPCCDSSVSTFAWPRVRSKVDTHRLYLGVYVTYRLLLVTISFFGRTYTGVGRVSMIRAMVYSSSIGRVKK